MARTFEFEVTARSGGAAQRVFDLVADGTRWPEWAGPMIRRARWTKAGAPDPVGVGAVREVGAWPLLVREETVVYEPGRRHVYVLRSPAPVRDYQGDVSLTPRADGGTDVSWRCSFTEVIPGTGAVINAGMRTVIGLFARRLARHAS